MAPAQLLFYRARYMDTANGNFLSPDTYRGDATVPPSLHRYVYALNNPVKYADPSGNEIMPPNPFLAAIATTASVMALGLTFALLLDVAMAATDGDFHNDPAFISSFNTFVTLIGVTSIFAILNFDGPLAYVMAGLLLLGGTADVLSVIGSRDSTVCEVVGGFLVFLLALAIAVLGVFLGSPMSGLGATEAYLIIAIINLIYFFPLTFFAHALTIDHSTPYDSRAARCAEIL